MSRKNNAKSSADANTANRIAAAAAKLSDTIAAMGAVPTAELLIADGQLRRFDVSGDKRGRRSGWLRFYPSSVAVLGNWRDGTNQTITAGAAKMSSGDDARIKEAKAQAGAERERSQKKAATLAR